MLPAVTRALTPAAHWYPVAIVGVLAAGLALRWSTLRAGFIADDYIQRAMLRNAFPVTRGPLDLFAFSKGASENEALRLTGFLPWWSHPDVKLALFRPLASALIWLDYQLFGDRAWLCHLHSLLWWLGSFAALIAVLQRLLPRPAVALALAFVMAHPAHHWLLGWLASRNAVIATFFALVGFWAELRARQDGWARGRTLALACYVLALAASEYALAVLAYPAAYACCEHRPGSRRFFRTLGAWLGLAGGYVVLRALLGYGARNSGMYLDPLSEPLAFLTQAPVRLFMLAGDAVLALRCGWALGGFPWPHTLETLAIAPRAWPVIQLTLGALAVVLVLARSARLTREPTPPGLARPQFLLVALPLSTLPLLATIPESRIVLALLLGWAIVLASWLWSAARVVLREPRELRSWRSWLHFAAPAALWSIGCIAPPVYSAAEVRNLPRLAAAVRAAILDRGLDEAIQSGPVLLVASADPTTFFLPMVRTAERRPTPGRFQVLSQTMEPQRLERLGPRSFALESDAPRGVGLRLPSAFNRDELRAGQRFVTSELRVQIERTWHGWPTRVRFDSARPLESFVLLRQTRDGLERAEFPEVGESLELPPPELSIDLHRTRSNKP